MSLNITKTRIWAIFSLSVLCSVFLVFLTQAQNSVEHKAVLAGESCAATESVQRTTNNHSLYKLQDEQGQDVFPTSVIRAKNDLYFLGPECLWWCLGAHREANGQDCLILKQIDSPKQGQLAVSWQEANDFVYLPQRESISIIDKSGDIFEYLISDPANKHWRIRRANSSELGPPDPEYIAACQMNDGILLLDPERNQIWFQTDKSSNLQALLPGVLSWKLKSGDINITDAISIAYHNGQTYVLRKHGTISKYGIKYGAGHNRRSGNQIFCVPQGSINFNHPNNFRPSRLYLHSDGMYVVERENNRVLKIPTTSGSASVFIFSGNSDLRGLVKVGDGFWIIDGNHILFRTQSNEETLSTKANKRSVDKRLTALILPIAGQSLPNHPGVFPGARRLYRYGVHNGLDMFNQPGAKIRVITGTPVRAACGGEITRIDLNYRDMNFATYNRVIRECFEAHQTSAKNADLLRGCQVWTDSGNGLISKYAHLSSANNKLRLGMNIKQGDIVGYVGISGTGENLPGHARYPHLHFEIWLDGKYLGYGLTPAETMSLFEDIFVPGRK
jgi:murein DD-endopeptidase MepM/ murein hydrolase activator NlpD